MKYIYAAYSDNFLTDYITHREKAVLSGLAHWVEGAGVGGGLEMFELILPVIVDESPL